MWPMMSNELGTIKPQGYVGLNSIMVYGENLQVAVGINHQLAIGSNYQICINPVGLVAEGGNWVPGAEAFTPLCGSGIGGNMQLTIGTSASVVFGQALDICIGPAKISLTGGKTNDIGGFLLCGALGLAALIWVGLYAIINSDAQRTNEAIIFQVIFEVLLVAIVAYEMNMKQEDTALETARATFYKTASAAWEPGAPWAAFGAACAVIAAMVAPPVIVAIEEGK